MTGGQGPETPGDSGLGPSGRTMGHCSGEAAWPGRRLRHARSDLGHRGQLTRSGQSERRWGNCACAPAGARSAGTGRGLRRGLGAWPSGKAWPEAGTRGVVKREGGAWGGASRAIRRDLAP